MTNILPLLSIVPVLPMIAEDFRKREVRLVWLILLAVCSSVAAFYTEGFSATLRNIVSNLLMLAFMGVWVTVWLWLKNRGTGVGIFPLRYLGAGDIVFLAALTPLFGLREYLIFLIAAAVGSLAWWLTVRIVRRRSVSIPFIGTSGIFLCAFLLIRIL